MHRQRKVAVDVCGRVLYSGLAGCPHHISSPFLKYSAVEPLFHLVRCETAFQQTVDHFIGISKSRRNGFQYTDALTLRLWVMVCKREAVAAPMIAVKRRRIKGATAEAAFPINLDDLTAIGLYPL